MKYKRIFGLFLGSEFYSGPETESAYLHVRLGNNDVILSSMI